MKSAKTDLLRKGTAWFPFIMSAAIVAGACYLNLYQLPFDPFPIILLLILIVPIFTAMALVYGIVLLCKPRMQRIKWPFRRWTTATVIGFLGISVLLSYYHIPKKIMFAVTRSQFKALELTPLKAPLTGSYVGAWKVLEAKIDRRGGLYIVTHEASDMIDMDREGLAYKPNPHGTPYGRAKYKLIHLDEDWYWFYANSDW